MRAAGSRDRVIEKIEYVPDEETELYFKAADVLILPYTHVFQSGVLFLGYSFGLPAIAADVGTLKEEIIEGETGFVFKPQDSSDLARKIDKYFKSELFRNLEARRAEIKAYANERYSWDKVATITTAVYSDLLYPPQGDLSLLSSVLRHVTSDFSTPWLTVDSTRYGLTVDRRRPSWGRQITSNETSVSILIPAYNAERWIADTIRSALAQTWPARRSLSLMMGHAIGRSRVARQFASRMFSVVTQENQGASAARNKAFELCQGDYIQWLDADDLLSPDKIAKQME